MNRSITNVNNIKFILPCFKRKNTYVFKKTFAIICILLISAISVCKVCYAEGEITVPQAYAWEQYLDVFFDGDINIDSSVLKISNKSAQIVDIGTLSDKNVTIRTTILIDISASVPKESRGAIVEFINMLIENTASNEQYRLVTFSDHVDILQDYTSDRYDLASSAAEIEFNGKQSRIYDAVYNTIPDVHPIDSEPCYYRTIIITDGVDNTAAGVTKEELYLQLQNEKYPIDIAAVSKEKQAEPEKELSAFSRVSGGRYVNIYPDADVDEITSAIDANNYFWMRVKIPDELSDGSTRLVNYSDINGSVQFDARMSLYDAPEEKSGTEDLLGADTTVLQTESQNDTSQKTDNESDESVSENNIILIIILAFSACLIVSAVIIIILLINKNKHAAVQKVSVSQPAVLNDNEGTVYVGEEIGGGTQFTIKLSNIVNPSQSWVIPVKGEIIIGRAANSEIKLDDKSVSHEQCKIRACGNCLEIINLSNTNKTAVNGAPVVNNEQLHSGDTIKLGRVVLHIDYIQSLDSSASFCNSESDSDNGNTVSLF